MMGLVKIADGKYLNFHYIVGLIPTSNCDGWTLLFRANEFISSFAIDESIAKEIAAKIEYYMAREELRVNESRQCTRAYPVDPFP